jgi:hypothetical protein
MSDLEVFQGHKVRFVGTADKPEWVAADVIAVLYPEAERSSYSKYTKHGHRLRILKIRDNTIKIEKLVKRLRND